MNGATAAEEESSCEPKAPGCGIALTQCSTVLNGSKVGRHLFARATDRAPGT